MVEPFLLLQPIKQGIESLGNRTLYRLAIDTLKGEIAAKLFVPATEAGQVAAPSQTKPKLCLPLSKVSLAGGRKLWRVLFT